MIWHFYRVKFTSKDGKETMSFPKLVNETFVGCALTEDDVRGFLRNFAPYRYSTLEKIELPTGPDSVETNLNF